MVKDKFKCSICDNTFLNGVQLGGHFSKAHPGQSTKYAKKLAIREERAKEREYLAKAKTWYKTNFGTAGSTSDPWVRYNTTKIKKILMAGKEPLKADFERKTPSSRTSATSLTDKSSCQ